MMFPLIFSFFLLQPSLLISSFGDSGCSDRKPTAYKDGDMMIAGFFPLYTITINPNISEPSEDKDPLK
jgi:hypothetical protein